MFIRAVKKKNKNSSKIYYAHKLVDSVRTEKGPRQKVVLNLGSLSLEQEKWKALANRIEEIIIGKQRLFQEDDEIEHLARHYAKLYTQQQIAENAQEPTQEQDFQSVDLNAVSSSEAKSIGREHLGLEAMRQLGLVKFLSKLGFTPNQVNLAVLSVVGRLIYPKSEYKLKQYAQNSSGLDILLGTDFSHIGQNALYDISDRLFDHKQEIEQFLRVNTKSLLGLSESIILYDLTNTYFEGEATDCAKAKRGKSKQKRNDRPQVTLGCVLDENGFLKLSQTFDGNVSEPSTLKEMVQTMHGQVKGCNPPLPLSKPTVVMDAGIASQENLDMLNEQGFSYLVVSKSRPKNVPEYEFTQVKQGVNVQTFQQGNEVFLHCWSEGKTQKERAIVHKAQTKMEKELAYLREGLGLKGRLKNYDKVLERIGRLRKQYSRVSKGFDIQVKKEGEHAVDITWTFDEQRLSKPYDGTYFLRTDRKDLSEKQIWQTYIMLTTVEDAFRNLKSELGLRPNYHHRSDRIEGHIFITMLAYHLLQWIQYHLYKAGLQHRWNTIHAQLDTHRILTSSLPLEGSGVAHIRHCTTATQQQSQIYAAMGIRSTPSSPKKMQTQ